jgi:hypothetical protein
MKVNILGRTVTGITGINFSSSRKKENQYGAGDEVDHRGYGNREYEVGITLKKYEVEAILALLLPGQDLTDVAPFDVPVQWMIEGNPIIHKVIIKDFEFTKQSVDTKQGDTTVDVSLECICSKVIWNAQ